MSAGAATNDSYASRRPRLAIVDYGIGNLHSAHKALERQGADSILTNSPEEIAAADAVVLPGVGAFGACMAALRKGGLESPVRDAVSSGRPFLGICVGTQMLFDSSDEDPSADGLGVIAGRVVAIPGDVKRPQMQWNRLHIDQRDPVLDGLGDDPWMYFVHSFHAVPQDPSVTVATCDYGGSLNVAFRQTNVFAAQFHPEKSGSVGLAMLGNFVDHVRSNVPGPARGDGSDPATVMGGGR